MPFLISGLGGPAGFGDNVLERGDDSVSGVIDLTTIFGASGLNFYGTSQTLLVISTNGHVTFGSEASPFFSHDVMTLAGMLPTIAPYFADVDTSGVSADPSADGSSTGSNQVWYHTDATGNGAMTITWDDVNAYGGGGQNAFQMRLIGTGGGNFTLELRYENIEWTTWDLAGGIGFSAGDGRHHQLLPASGNADQLTQLDSTAGNTGEIGVYQYHFISGVPDAVTGAVDLTGSDGADVLVGTAQDDQIDGGAGDDSLVGGDGHDTLQGGSGRDTLSGDLGNDVYRLDSNEDEVLEDVSEGIDTIEADGVSMALVWQVENLTLLGDAATRLDGTGNELDNLILGHAGSNLLTGGSGHDTLDGGAGLDTLSGEEGDDVYRVDDSLDVVIEAANQGFDTIVSRAASFTLFGEIESLVLAEGSAAVDGTGRDLADRLVGNSAANRLDGRAGDDTMVGGAGDDTYLVDSAGDVIVENADEGSDTIETALSFTATANVENLHLTGSGDVDATGSAVANRLTGNAGHNRLDGAAGGDTLIGGAGNDTYVVDDAGDVVIESAGEGNDTLLASLTFTAADNVENLVLTGAGAVDATGNTLANQLTGNAADNRLDGGSGADTLTGGAGNDTYLVDDAGDVIVENADGGSDTVVASVSFTAADQVEHLQLAGTAAIDATGNALANLLSGNTAANRLSGLAGDDRLDGGAGNDTLDGGAGVDTLVGGTGDDTYVVTTSEDLIIELAGEGSDTVLSSISLTLATTLENLTLTGTAAVDAQGHTGANFLTGNVAANRLDGGSGADTLAGGAGDDTYVIDQAGDVVVEQAGDGLDTVLSAVSHTLSANVENLVLRENTGTLQVYRNDFDGQEVLAPSIIATRGGVWSTESVQGLSALGFSGSFLRNDSAGPAVATTLTLDNLPAHTAIDIDFLLAYLESWDGTQVGDWLTVTIDGQAVLQMSVNTTAGTAFGQPGTALGATTTSYFGQPYWNELAYDMGTASALSFAHTGASLTLQVIAGGADWQGGSDESWAIDNLNISVIAPATATTTNGTGNTLDNLLTGNSARNRLEGLAGADTLDGGAGLDTLVGGTGNDTYVVDLNTDRVIERSAADGVDTVLSSASFFTLEANVENLVLTGTASIGGAGNALANVITGNAGNNLLDGGDGNDTVFGGAGNDSLYGGAGSDSMLGGAGNDVYRVGLTTDVVVELANEGTDTVEAVNTSYTLSDHVENLVLTGAAYYINATGNALANQITGNWGYNLLTGGAGNDTIDGGEGADTAVGGTGDDTYIVNSSADIITELAGEGTDVVLSTARSFTMGANVEHITLQGTGSISAIGNASANTMTGNSGDNTLDGGDGNDSLVGGAGFDSLLGGAGSDTMAGGADSDFYRVGSAGDVVIELAGEGLNDTVEAWINYTLGANVEHLTLGSTNAINGTGNSANNVLTGNAANNVLDGLSGADTMSGGAGNDTYVVDNAGDVVNEALNAGTDQVNASVSYTLKANVEKLTLTGSGNLNGYGSDDANTITGNAGNNLLDGGLGNDTLLGGAGNDTLLGNAGDDSMVGGTGNDTYRVASAGDVAVELAGEGTDTVEAYLTYTLGANIENVTLFGSAVNATGNALANQITGNSLANTLDGGTGNDTYVMGRGSNADTIRDSDATAGNLDVLSFTSGIATDQLWFRHLGNDLEVAIIGTSDKATVKDWYLGSQNHLEQFRTADGKVLLDTAVDNLVNAMASFAPPAAGQTTLPANYQASLSAVIAANWQ